MKKFRVITRTNHFRKDFETDDYAEAIREADKRQNRRQNEVVVLQKIEEKADRLGRRETIYRAIYSAKYKTLIGANILYTFTNE